MPGQFITSLLLFLLYASTLSAAAELLPALKSSAESRPAIIRGLFDLDKRQAYTYCPSPAFICERYYCCTNTNWHCCRDGSCCQPNTYCVIASNGKIGCCPIGELCSGPVGDPHSTTIYYTTTRTHTSTSTRTIPKATTTPLSTVRATPAPTFSEPSSSAPDTAFTPIPTVSAPPLTTSLTSPAFVPSPAPDNANTTSSSLLAQPTFPSVGATSSGVRAGHAGVVALLTLSSMVFVVSIF